MVSVQQTTQSIVPPHLLRHLILCSVAALSCFSGFLLPSLPVPDNSFFVAALPREKSSVGKIIRSSQIANEEIVHIKAKPSVLAAKITTAGETWGVAKQIGEHTWTMKVSSDATVGTAQEILHALNDYRQKHGAGSLLWDTNLGNFAQSRADAFFRNGTTDAHAGFTDFMNNQDGFKKTGFMALGENSSFGYHIEAVHLIEWVYAGDAPHNDNQLNSQWTHVGIGVAGLATDLVFGGRKI